MTNRRFCGSSPKRSLLLIAPSDAQLQPFDGKITRSSEKHADLITQIQRLRGQIYLEDGAIEETALTSDGRHLSSLDKNSWHLVTVDNEGEVLGCTRFRQHRHSARFQDLSLKESAQARCSVWGSRLEASISADLCTAKQFGLKYVEVGGWALSRQLRGTVEALQSVLAIFAWSQVVGGAIGVSTATERNGSASILKRLGGGSMHWNGTDLPPYYDDQYKCGMEILRFDSRLPNPRYAASIQDLRGKLSKIELVQNTPDHVIHHCKPAFFVPDFNAFAGVPATAF